MGRQNHSVFRLRRANHIPRGSNPIAAAPGQSPPPLPKSGSDVGATVALGALVDIGEGLGDAVALALAVAVGMI